MKNIIPVKRIFCAVMLACGSTYALAAPGDLDTTFDSDGKLATVIGAGADAAFSVVQQTDGKLVVAGYSNNGSNNDFAVVRYNANGSLDTSFDGDGKVITDIGADDDIVTAVIQQADGKLLAAGYSLNAGTYEVSMVRYNANGTLDTSFSGDGKLTAQLGNSHSFTESLIQQADGKLVVAFSGTSSISLARFNLDGSLDTSFDTDGQVNTSVGPNSSASSVIQQADGKLVAAGYSTNGNDWDFALVRYNADGSLDTSFDTDGQVTTAIGIDDDMARSVIQQADGKLVAVGDSKNLSAWYIFALARYSADGSLDTAFDGDGKLTTTIGTANHYAYSVIQQANGKLVIAGDAYDGSNNEAGFTLVRYGTNGALDTTFSGDGIVTTAMGVLAYAPVQAMIQQIDGKLVAAGIGSNGSNTDFVVARYDSEVIDTDGDGLSNGVDNCPFVSNVAQTNTDGDSQGDACDTDDDDDTVPDISDNCSLVVNTDQLNTNGDNLGNACDPDDDGDGVVDASDAFPLDISESEDEDHDNLGDNSDPILGNADTLNEIAGLDKGEKSGASVAFVGDFNGDGYGDYAVGSPGFDSYASGKLAKDVGLVKVYSGKNGNVLASVEGMKAKDAMGFAIAGNADINDDGFMDVIVGAPFADNLSDPANKRVDAGSVTVLYGPTGASESQYGDQAKALYGSAVALGDLNGDGFAEFIVGAPKADDTVNKLVDVGAVTIYDHSGNELRKHLGAVKKGYLGSSIAVGDYNGAGGNDVMIGAPGTSNNGMANAGYAVVYSSISATTFFGAFGTSKNEYYGKFVASGDVNNDGHADLLVGSPGYDEGKFKDIGKVTVVFDTLPVQLFTGDGAVVKAADVNGDGDTDVIIGYPKADFAPSKLKDNGSVTVLLKSGLGYSRNVKRGNASKDYYGTSFDLGDVNGDGKADIIHGIPGYDTPLPPTTKSVKDTGKVQIISGSSI